MELISVMASYWYLPGSTIQEAIDAASDGDQILVEEGVYYENVMIDKGISLVSANRENTILDAGGVGSALTFANGSEIQVWWVYPTKWWRNLCIGLAKWILWRWTFYRFRSQTNHFGYYCTK